ncbi:hypothetical protein [Polymorphospora lycopeni]|uniref:Uncharacterized protein n=1 Tax=Polymorphospora lycopeni TaxID=3140240 RepID=A0ABV5CKZ1_9ACTN
MTTTATAKLDRLEARAALAPTRPGPAAEFVQYAEGIINNEKVTVRIVDGRMHYETHAEGMRKLTRAEVLVAVAPPVQASPIARAAHVNRIATLSQLSNLGAPVVLVTATSRHTGYVIAQDDTHIRLTGGIVIALADLTDVGTYNA